MTEAKRGRGRPKKEQKIENPDCAPATKGFVKCLMRKYDNTHTHEQTSGGEYILALSIVFAAAWVCIVVSKHDDLQVYAWMVGLLSVVTLVTGFGVAEIGGSRTCTPTGMFENTPKYLDAYVEPKPECKPKKGCE